MRPRQTSQGSDDDGTLPVFISPTELKYYTDDISSHKQVVTIYNPYSYTLKYKVLCTAPRKYHVIESEGLIKSHCRIDVVIRHKEPLDESTLDKFQIQLFDNGSSAIRGHKQVISHVLPRKPKVTVQEAPMQQLPPPEHQETFAVTESNTDRGQHRMDPLVLLVAAVCGMALLLPTWQVDSSTLPPYLHLTIHQKLVVAYVLGLVTMVILHF
ncbi:motile sperm domain-containing protein 1-like isoform X3 [Bolinopsis microptera]|uniref:motile sperm domain-containing protein 1-like isoform X3 n=1 Tax=Bolinopsis microptera TaxID=2820187 RepID=UPI0030797788